MICEIQTTLTRIWTRVAISISYDDNYKITCACIDSLYCKQIFFYEKKLANYVDRYFFLIRQIFQKPIY